MAERSRQIHQKSYESYGMPRVRAELIEQGVCISRQRVARLMREAGVHGISKRRGFSVTTRRDKHQTPAHDLVNRCFHATGPNQLWVADMTYVPTWMGFLYLAVVIDVWSRRVVGWAMGERMTADLVLAALNMALEQRKPKWAAAGAIDTDLSFLSLLELYGTEIAERRMPAPRVVEALDVVEHV